MRRLFGVLIVIAIVIVGIGFQRGWFALSSPSSGVGSSEVNVNLATDTGKIKADAEKVKDKAAELTGSATDGPAEPADDVRPTDSSPDDGQTRPVETSAVPSRGN